MRRRILLLQVAALGHRVLAAHGAGERWHGMDVHTLSGLFPAVTCPVQATMRTATLPSRHGIVGNGFLFREQGRPLFWEQDARLVRGRPVWEGFRSRGGTVGQMFIQQSLGPESDLLLSPAPIHRHHGGMFVDCYARPVGLYPRLKKRLGAFPLHRYWGPLASLRSSEWIGRAIADVLGRERPGFLYAYLPHLDYVFQRAGPCSDAGRRAFRALDEITGEVLGAARRNGYGTVLFGDYAVTGAREVVFPNRRLREAGLLQVRRVAGMTYPDHYASAAFCVVDHQVAHVYVKDRRRSAEAADALNGLEGVERIVSGGERARLGIGHSRCGELVLVARKGAWFDYRWWRDRSEAPDYARHVDIHNKPGYDPCELFFGWPPPSISDDPGRVKGTHGRVDDDELIPYAADLPVPGSPEGLPGLARGVRSILDGMVPV